MSEENGALGQNLLLFLLGAAAGAVVVALVTPKSGPDLRAEIGDLTDKLKRKAKEMGTALSSVCASGDEPEHEEPGAQEDVIGKKTGPVGRTPGIRSHHAAKGHDA
jgi:gas vesicle protein